MKCYLLLTILVLGFASKAFSSPTEQINKTKEKVIIELKDSNEAPSSDEALKTSDSFGLGYYPAVPYGGMYALPRPEMINYGLGGYGAYGGGSYNQWSQQYRYNAYRAYNGFYQAPVYTYWG